MRCVENSIDVNVFAFSPEKRNRLRSEQRVPDDRRVVMLLGRIDEVKGHRTFIDAAARVSAEYRDVDFWCVGGGDVRLRESLQARAGQLGLVDRLRWLGEAKDVTAFYSAADLAVSASLSEGFPNSVAEAMACGLRVVGTDVGDTARIVVDQGMIVPPGDPEALAAAILSCLLAPAAERASVRAAFLGRFDPQQLLLRHEDALAAVAHAR
ncbi:MAG: glycosyltransferase [Dehalococcoidia bacterium]